MRMVWEYSTHQNIDAELPEGLLVHKHRAYEGKNKITVVTNTKPEVETAKQLHLQVLEELEPMWYVNEYSAQERKTTFRIIKRCRYCQKYYKTEQEPALGNRYVMRPKFNSARHENLGVRTIFPDWLIQHESLVVEYRPAESDEDHVVADLNGREFKLAVVRPILPEEKFTHQTCTLREELIKQGPEFIMELYDTPQKGGRFYYYPASTQELAYGYAGNVKHEPGTWAFKFDLSDIRKHHGKYQVFRFTHKNRSFVGFFN